MTRWFTALLYALMLACAALPASAAAAAAQAPVAAVNVMDMMAGSQDAGEPAALTAEPAERSSTANDGNAPEVPELFVDALPHLTLPVQTAEVPPSIAVPLSPHPFLKGPQRPPRAPALPLAA